MLYPVWSPGGYIIELAIRKTIDAFSSSAGNTDVSAEELSESATKANIQSSVLQEQAKVEQELSIAKRILIAEEVEIEEYYDTSGKGSLGVQNSKDDGFTFGASGSGHKITKRVVKFKGFNAQANDMLANLDAEKLRAEPQSK
ncbi:hypothetical protein [Pantoea ananatis]|uniref:hypothetical protein n=1 Tax=Pantoea ananas TaxID=553 RepID=UPI001B30FB4A|nr:hypothetical protein [Pantoea ananatis]